MKRLAGLYAITDGRRGRELIAATAAALRGGVRLVQYRDKQDGRERREAEARDLCRLAHDYGALLLINDDPWLAARVGADGVHLGREDPDIALARGLLGAAAVIGVSCYDSLARARTAVAAGADYVAFGSVFPSPTKPHARRVPLDLIRRARCELAVPVCAIGGITRENITAVFAAGADLPAVVSAVFSAADIEAAARSLVRIYATSRRDVKPGS